MSCFYPLNTNPEPCRLSARHSLPGRDATDISRRFAERWVRRIGSCRHSAGTCTAYTAPVLSGLARAESATRVFSVALGRPSVKFSALEPSGALAPACELPSSMQRSPDSAAPCRLRAPPHRRRIAWRALPCVGMNTSVFRGSTAAPAALPPPRPLAGAFAAVPRRHAVAVQRHSPLL
jgi:hypothetical protein